MKHPYIPKGCDQQGRWPQVDTEIMGDDPAPEPMDWFLTSIIYLASAALVVIGIYFVVRYA